MLAFVDSLVENVAFGIKTLKTVATNKAQFERVIVDDMHPAHCSPEEKVSTFIQIQGNQVELPLILVIGRQVHVLSQSNATAKRCGALRCIKQRDLGNILR